MHEDAGALTLHLQRHGDLSRATSVEVVAIDDARSDNPADEGIDFALFVQRLNFPAGTASLDVTIQKAGSMAMTPTSASRSRSRKTRRDGTRENSDRNFWPPQQLPFYSPFAATAR